MQIGWDVFSTKLFDLLNNAKIIGSIYQSFGDMSELL